MASDDRNASATYSFIVDITNQAPEILGPISPLTAYDNISFTKTVNFSDYFRENDAQQSLNYFISGIPSFMTENLSGDTVTFTGNASTSLIGTNYTIQLAASDTYELSTINLTVNVIENEPPAAPQVTYPVTLLEGQQGTFTIDPFTDAEGDSITYS